MVNKKGLIVEGFPTIAMDGFHAAQIIHNTYGVPVVFRTAHGDEGRPDWAVSPAPRLWLRGKPFAKDELAQAFERVLHS